LGVWGSPKKREHKEGKKVREGLMGMGGESR